MVIFQESWLEQALKVTIVQWLLLLRRASKLSEMKVKTLNFQLLKGISFPTLTGWDVHIWTYEYVGADQYLEIFLDLQLFCAYQPVTYQYEQQIWQLNFWNAIRRLFFMRCCDKMLLWQQGSTLCNVDRSLYTISKWRWTNVWCKQFGCESRFKTETMFGGDNIFLNSDLTLKTCYVIIIWHWDLAVTAVHWTYSVITTLLHKLRELSHLSSPMKIALATIAVSLH